jgi:Histidine phosphatase superfamily (branch 2)
MMFNLGGQLRLKWLQLIQNSSANPDQVKVHSSNNGKAVESAYAML